MEHVHNRVINTKRLIVTFNSNKIISLIKDFTV